MPMYLANRVTRLDYDLYKLHEPNVCVNACVYILKYMLGCNIAKKCVHLVTFLISNR